MFSTFNMGIGFCIVVDSHSVDKVMVAAGRHDPTVIGRITNDDGVRLI